MCIYIYIIAMYSKGDQWHALLLYGLVSSHGGNYSESSVYKKAPCWFGVGDGTLFCTCNICDDHVGWTCSVI